MLNNEENKNALNAIARKCNAAMKDVGKENIPELIKVTNRHEEMVKLLGFTKTDLLVEIGIINGRLTDKKSM